MGQNLRTRSDEAAFLLLLNTGYDAKIRAHWIVRQEDFRGLESFLGAQGSLTQAGLNRPGWPAKRSRLSSQRQGDSDGAGGPDPEGSGKVGPR